MNRLVNYVRGFDPVEVVIGAVTLIAIVLGGYAIMNEAVW